MNPKKILIDTDNTLGQQFRWNDDGLAILYTIGKNEFDLVGITTTFGNSSGKNVYKNTKKLLDAIGKDELPLIRGADEAGDLNTEASSFLAEKAASEPGSLILLALGPLTNLQGAYEQDPNFFNNLKEIILMGGITKERLEVGRIKMKDVNLRADLDAALTVLTADCPVTVINCHVCKQVPFQEDHMDKIQFWPEGIIEEIEQEFWINEKVQKIDEIFIWDVLVPVYLAHPEFFEENKIKISASAKNDIKDGRLREVREDGVQINMPEKIVNKKSLYEDMFSTWETLHESIMKEKGSYNDFGHSAVSQAIFKAFFTLLIPLALRLMYKKRENYFYEE